MGDVRRIIGQSLLALARKEISAADVAAMSKGVDALANSLHAEVALFKLKTTCASMAQSLENWYGLAQR